MIGISACPGVGFGRVQIIGNRKVTQDFLERSIFPLTDGADEFRHDRRPRPEDSALHQVTTDQTISAEQVAAWVDLAQRQGIQTVVIDNGMTGREFCRLASTPDFGLRVEGDFPEASLAKVRASKRPKT